MRRVLRLILRGLIGVVALVGVLGALLGYFVYSPAPEVSRLSGTLMKPLTVTRPFKDFEPYFQRYTDIHPEYP